MFNALYQWLTTGRRAAANQAHITFGQTSIGRSLSRTGLLLKRQLWIWPILAVVVLATLGYGIRIAIERTMRASLQSQLETLLSVERQMLETWLEVQESNAEALANDQQVRELTAQILALTQPPVEADESLPNSLPTTSAPLANLASLRARLGQELSPGMSAHNFTRYILADKQHRIVAATSPELVGQTIPHYEPFLSRALEGQITVSPPFSSVVLMKDEQGRTRTGVPTMFVCSPVRNANLEVVAVLGLRIRPEREFAHILQLGRFGESGETYAIDKSGLMVSSSRFDEDLILTGILPDREDSQSILNVSVRDPGGNIAKGYRPKVRRADLPFTRAAGAAVDGVPGVDLDGYRDYRGVPVVGAWQWLPQYDIGLITEMDYAEAYRPLTILRWSFFFMFGLLVASSVAIFVFTLIVARLQREARNAAIEARQLGQYRLEEKLGSGGMGVVYKGHHAMLRRPTAIKMLNVDKVNETSIQRFEREVQVTCQLNNPNTVAVYDYGRTPEGIFYYAMEYLDGIDLQQLVEQYGPQPEGRVIRILKAVCSSLYEAHSLGLVHRDIKPANVMLNRRGAEPDVVKVLDFGLVRALDEDKVARQTSGLAGTPLYMSPEAIQSPDAVDPRSDIYAVGAVGYFLVTGQPVFDAGTLVELCQKHLTTLPASPSERLGRNISPELENTLLACLEKNSSKRPQTARDLAERLDRSAAAQSWSPEDADSWWTRHDRSKATSAANANDGSPRPLSGGTPMAAAPPASGNGTAPSAPPPRTTNRDLDQTIANPPGHRPA